jgi:hypothetical protein
MADIEIITEGAGYLGLYGRTQAGIYLLEHIINIQRRDRDNPNVWHAPIPAIYVISTASRSGLSVEWDGSPVDCYDGEVIYLKTYNLDPDVDYVSFRRE